MKTEADASLPSVGGGKQWRGQHFENMNQVDLDEASRRAMAEVNRLFGSFLQSKQARYRYFTDGRSKNMYFWTTHKIGFNSKPRFVSGIYRHFKTKGEWIAKHKVGHARRKAAKARAMRLMARAREGFEQKEAAHKDDPS